MALCSRRFPRFVERDTAVDAVDIESKNKFRWDWLLLKDDSGDFFSDYFRNIEKDGFAWCCFCKCEIKYCSGGVRCFKDHANRCKAHERNRSRRIFRSIIVFLQQCRQYAVRSLVLQTLILIATLCLDLLLVHPHYLMVLLPTSSKSKAKFIILVFMHPSSSWK